MWCTDSVPVTESLDARGYSYGTGGAPPFFLGSGAHGTCHVVLDLKGTAFALKLTEVGHDEVATCMREIEVMLSVPTHPHIVALVDHWLVPTPSCAVLCMVLELCEAGDLSAYSDTFYPPEPLLLDWTVQILSALSHLHAHGVVHRDVKPQNIFMCNAGGILKLGDFGVSRVLTSTRHAHSTVGTPQYMAPEVFDGVGHTSKADVWGFGTVLYYVMSGQQAFRGPNLGRLMYSVLKGSFQPLHNLHGVSGRYTPGLQRLVQGMLVTDPQGRPSCEALLRSPALLRRVAALPRHPHREGPLSWLAEGSARTTMLAMESVAFLESIEEPLGRASLTDAAHLRGFAWDFLRGRYVTALAPRDDDDPMAVVTATMARTAYEDGPNVSITLGGPPHGCDTVILTDISSGSSIQEALEGNGSLTIFVDPLGSVVNVVG